MRSVYVFVINIVYCHVHFLLKLKYVRASALVDIKFLYILQKKKKFSFSILHIYFYKTSTLICLFYTLFYLNNIFLTFFIIISHLPYGPPTLTHMLNAFPLFFPFFFFPFRLFLSSPPPPPPPFIILSIHISLFLPSSLNSYFFLMASSFSLSSNWPLLPLLMASICIIFYTLLFLRQNRSH